MANANEATALSPSRLRILSEKLAAGKGLHGKLSVVRALTKERWSANAGTGMSSRCRWRSSTVSGSTSGRRPRTCRTR